MEDNNTDGKWKITPSIPENYISIRHLQDRWINEKGRKRKEEEEKRGNQQAEKQRTIEDDLKKTEEARGDWDEEKRLDRRNRKNWGRNSRKMEPMNGGDAKFAEKEGLEVTAAIGSERSEEAAAPKKKKKNNKGSRRKRYPNKKKENQDVAVVEDVVVDCETGSIAPPPEVVATEKITPVKDVIGVYRKKGRKATGKKSVEYREKAVTDDAATAIETRFEDLSIKNGETKYLKAQTRPSNRNQLNQGNDLVHQRVRRPIGAGTSTMVWVKKEQSQRAGDGIANGVKPLNA